MGILLGVGLAGVPVTNSRFGKAELEDKRATAGRKKTRFKGEQSPVEKEGPGFGLKRRGIWGPRAEKGVM